MTFVAKVLLTFLSFVAETISIQYITIHFMYFFVSLAVDPDNILSPIHGTSFLILEVQLSHPFLLFYFPFEHNEKTTYDFFDY